MNNGECFSIETEEELKQAHEMFRNEWHPFLTSLENDIEGFRNHKKYKRILKDKGYVYFGVGRYLNLKEIPSPLKKNTITNPIKDNRIVSDDTFALRLCSFLDDIYVGDACSDDEASYLKSVARELLTYQYQTATGEYEVGYIERLEDSFKQHLEKGFTTEDGYTFYRGDNTTLFSCMRQPLRSDDNTIMFSIDRILEGGTNPDRVLFKEKSNRDKYIEGNLIQYSKKDLEELIKSK